MDPTGYGNLRARREATIWQQMNHVLRVLLFIAVWLLIISFFLPPYKKLQQNRAEIEQLQAQLNEEQTNLAQQTKESNALENGSDLSGNHRTRQPRADEGRRDDLPPGNSADRTSSSGQARSVDR